MSRIVSQVPPVATLVLQHATVVLLAQYLNPAVPWVWILDRVPNTVVEWWKTSAPLTPLGESLFGEVRLLRYDLQLPTAEFLSRIAAFEECGISFVQSRRSPMLVSLRNPCVKFYLTECQVLHLLCIGGRCNLSPFDRFKQRRRHMTNGIYLITRVAQALLAVTATGASVLVFQW